MSVKEKKNMVNIKFCGDSVYCVVYYDGKSKYIAMPVNSKMMSINYSPQRFNNHKYLHHSKQYYQVLISELRTGNDTVKWPI